MKASSNAKRSSFLETYPVEIARGGSYLVSTTTPESRNATLTEMVQDFVEIYSESNLPTFLSSVEGWLVSRDHAELAAAVAYYRENGKPPEVMEPSKARRLPKALRDQKLKGVAKKQEPVPFFLEVNDNSAAPESRVA